MPGHSASSCRVASYRVLARVHIGVRAVPYRTVSYHVASNPALLLSHHICHTVQCCPKVAQREETAEITMGTIRVLRLCNLKARLQELLASSQKRSIGLQVNESYLASGLPQRCTRRGAFTSHAEQNKHKVMRCEIVLMETPRLKGATIYEHTHRQMRASAGKPMRRADSTAVSRAAGLVSMY